ncbi:MAG: hypothetical protein A2086_01655 [Spirochaetes bacterium GWD1_27_9]|nr:MAG: hypothetical protein A2Z98_04075 [Spirochaetes bacterium GWB1_27_13]OHD20625.1 MAG: hypothetical protein A2Y34_17555 [Spirochaetes bacterium GWC1_27_15]OHD41808.1 MAG: hypothetical protein A2086_01655 [Spirochaetes bacterium GWD1_27_9]
MKNYLFLIFLLTCFNLFSANLPKLYFNFGTKRDDIIFEMGEPKYHLPGGHLLYETYSSVRTLETLTFLVDENLELFGITIDIGLDYSPSIPEKEFQNKVFKHYKDFFISVYGEPYISNKVGLLWKFDNGFCVFQPYIKDTFLRFKYFCFPKEYAKDTGYGSIYE